MKVYCYARKVEKIAAQTSRYGTALLSEIRSFKELHSASIVSLDTSHLVFCNIAVKCWTSFIMLSSSWATSWLSLVDQDYMSKIGHRCLYTGASFRSLKRFSIHLTIASINSRRSSSARCNAWVKFDSGTF